MAIRQDKTQEFEYGSLARCRGDTRTVVFQVFPVTQVVFQNLLVIFLVGLDPVKSLKQTDCVICLNKLFE